ncbi:MAG TPA: hypothetical protein VGC55_12920 [Dokdonella sp.]
MSAPSIWRSAGVRRGRVRRVAGWFALSLLVLPGSALVHADPPTAFDVKASVRRTASVQASAGFALEARAATRQTSASAGRYEVTASAAQAPLACAADLVFKNGFD